MQRRDFLRLAGLTGVGLVGVQGLGLGLAGAAGAAQNVDPMQTSSGGRLYRGTAEGKVLVSDDSGRTWSSHTNFGPLLPVNSISANGAKSVSLVLGFKGMAVPLVLRDDGKSWRTA